ncbi:hypothetical protein BHE74_00015987 [Ensete ventricosum]|nr:hypothetical protein BHE74_00015987 [Ensete ventricosum]RZR90590.1 hypothetical protein BHM03_00018505 [Ensete ventricosum]
MYRFDRRLVRGPSTIERYHRLRLFPPRYHLKLVGNDHCRRLLSGVMVNFDHHLFRAVSPEGEKRENLEIRRCSSDLDPCLQASRRFSGRIIGDRGKKKMMVPLPTRASWCMWASLGLLFALLPVLGGGSGLYRAVPSILVLYWIGMYHPYRMVNGVQSPGRRQIDIMPQKI